MVEELDEIFEHIKKNNNFLLSGGAGSGKTYSLVKVIQTILDSNSKAKIACITYTNAAVKEIESRISNNNLKVSTIHDFLWDNIKTYQKELKETLYELITEEESTIKTTSTITYEKLCQLEEGIQYKEYLKINEGIISHDELLILANRMYKKYVLLSDITKDCYDFIFVDEYQDTSPLVVEIFLNYFNESNKKNIIGFFGDSMQSIYDNGIGDLQKYIDDGKIKEVIKKQNRRNPLKIINLANKLRSDNVVQEPSNDSNAPNMLNGKIIEGDIKFIYSNNILEFNELKGISIFDDWNNTETSKELNLTHRLIAHKAGFEDLYDIYDKDPIIELKNSIISYLKKYKKEINDSDTFETIVNDIIKEDSNINNKYQKIINNCDNKLLFEELKDELFTDVKKIYFTKDSLIDDKKNTVEEQNRKGSKRDDLIKHLFKIQEIIDLYNNKNYNEFINKVNFNITKIEDKIMLKEKVNQVLLSFEQNNIGFIIDLMDKLSLCYKDDKLVHFIKNNKYLYNRVKNIEYQQFQKLYNYLEGCTPLSTQHKVKGTEYDNVLVILDNGKWNQYNFEYLFTKPKDKESIVKRTEKIFYVCCTRAKKRLIVYYCTPSELVINKAKEIFGEENVINIDTYL